MVKGEATREPPGDVPTGAGGRRTSLLARGTLACALSAMVTCCATPVPPSGGPRDRTPPAVTSSEPADAAVNVDASRLRITFDEHVDQASFARAFAITPEMEGQPSFDWSGRTVTVRFPDALRANTTYIFTLSTDLRDLHGVTLAQPITLAFSTGPTINRGRIRGTVVEASTGMGAGGLDVLAYPAPDSIPPNPLPERPAYRTETDPEGHFQLDYLNEQPYYVVVLDDRNRNRHPDALERFAVPPQPALVADTLDAAVTAPWVVTRRDTLRPTAQRVRSLSQRRHRVRFSEPIRLTSLDPTTWSLADSVGGQAVPVTAVYIPAGETAQIDLVTPPLPPVTHRLVPGAVADTSGNAVRRDTLWFVPSADADTMQYRFLGFVPDTSLVTSDGFAAVSDRRRAGVRFNQAVDSLRLHAMLAATDTLGNALAYTAQSDDGRTYHLRFSPPLAPGRRLRLAVDGHATSGVDTVYAQTFQRFPDRDLGELSGVVRAPVALVASVVVELIADNRGGKAVLDTSRIDTTGAFLFDGLPAGTYRFRAFADVDGDGRWDGGAVVPYRDAEPVTWSPDTYQVRVRWETAIRDTLRLAPR